VVASSPRCRSIPSFERFLSVPCCRTVRALITLRRLCIWRVAPMVGGAPTRRGWVARALGSARGAPTPRGSPRALPGERLSGCALRFCRLPPAPGSRGTRHGRCVHRLQGAAALRYRLSHFAPCSPCPLASSLWSSAAAVSGGWLRVARSQRSGAFQIDGAHTVTP